MDGAIVSTMTATSMRYMPELLREEAKNLGYDLYSEVIPSAIGLPVPTKLSAEDWESEANRLVEGAYEIGQGKSNRS